MRTIYFASLMAMNRKPLSERATVLSNGESFPKDLRMLQPLSNDSSTLFSQIF
jgi:hypothetical protein